MSKGLQRNILRDVHIELRKHQHPPSTEDDEEGEKKPKIHNWNYQIRLVQGPWCQHRVTNTDKMSIITLLFHQDIIRVNIARDMLDNDIFMLDRFVNCNLMKIKITKKFLEGRLRPLDSG